MTFIHSQPMTGFMASYDHDQRRWLEDILVRHNLTATELARRAGLDPSTLTRFMTGGRDGHMLSQRTIRKIESATAERREKQTAGFAEDEGRPVAPETMGGSPLQAAIEAMRAGRNGVDPWLVSSADLEGIRIFQDDILMVDLNAEPTAGDIVCAQVYDWPTGRARTVFRLYEPPFLLSGNIYSGARRPEAVDGRNVVIRGVVVARLSARGMLRLPN